MKLRNFLGLFIFLLVFAACGDDDDNTPETIPVEEIEDQSVVDDEEIRNFLSSHFYNYEEFQNPPADFDYEIRFTRITPDNQDKTPLIDQVETRMLNRLDFDQKYYVLKTREGVGESVTFADSTLLNYRGIRVDRFDDDDDDFIPNYADISFDENTDATDSDNDQIIDEFDADNDGVPGTDDGVLDSNNDGIKDNTVGVFDQAITPVWFNLPSTIEGFAHGIQGAKGGSGFTVNSDGTTTFNEDYGIGAIFMPSGLGYYAAPPPASGIGLYNSLIFTFQLLDGKVTDHDGDGIISINEDLNNNGFLFDSEIDNTDEDLLFNFLDPDDDNDGVRTRLETVRENDEFVSVMDTDNDGIPDHIDADDDGDGRDTIDEIEINPATGNVTFPDTDGDGIPDYLDSDS